MRTFLQLDPETAILAPIDLERGIAGLPLKPRTGAEVAARAAEVAEALRA